MMTLHLIRGNDRLVDQPIIGNRVLVTEGWGANRGTRKNTDPVYGSRPVSASTPGAIMHTHIPLLER